MKHINSIVLTLLTALLSMPVSAKSTVALATPEQLEAAGLSSSPVEIPGGTIIFDNEIATFSLAYTDLWGTDENYGIHNLPSSSYKIRVGSSDVFTVGVSPAGQTNPTFSGYEDGVMSAGSVFKIDAKMSGWITVFNILFNPDKKYVVFENETRGVPYTLGGSDGDYKINYCLPMATSGDDTGYVTWNCPNSDRYFQTMDSGNHRPQSPYVTAGMESAPDYGMGYMTFKVTAGNSYYVSGLGSRMLCQGYVFSDDATEPAVTYLATGELPEVKFRTRDNMPKMEGDDFEFEGIWYTVIDAEAKTVKTKDGYIDGNQWIPGNNVEEDVTIPGIVSDGNNDYTVISIGEMAFCECTNLTSIILPEGVTSIGGRAFFGCLNLTSINIPAQVTSIEIATFRACRSLASINLPASLTSIEGQSFLDCSSLTSINVPEGVISIGNGAFFACSNLTSINLPASLTSIEGQVFSNCSSLTSINIPEGVTEIGNGAFDNCSSLTSINIPNGVTSIGENAFWHCSSLKSINLPSSLVSIGENAFVGCNPNAKISYVAASPITAPENVFDGLYDTAILNMPNATLADIQATAPWNKFLRITASDGSVAPAGEGEDFVYDGITYTVIDVENRTCRTKIRYFDSPYCKVSGALDIPAIVSDGVYDYTVVEIGRLGFQGATITSLTLPESITNIGENAFQDCDSLKTVNLPASMPSVEYGVFSGCTSIRNVNYAASVPIPSAENLFDAAAYCMAILNIPNATLADVEASVPWNKFRRIEASDGSLNVPLADGDDFEYEGLWYTVLDANNNTVKTKDGYTLDGYYFSFNKAEGDLVIPAEVFYDKQKYTVEAIGSFGFYNTRMTSVFFPNTLKSIGLMAFKYCSDLNSITFPESLTKIDADAFSFCTNLEEIELPDNLTVIERSDFSGCTALTSVKFPDSLTRIGNGAFHSCKNLKSVSLPPTLKRIDAYAFNTCNSLTSLALPDSLTLIQESVFEKCINLTEIYLPASIEIMGGYIFRGCDNISDVTYDAVHPVAAISAFSDIVYENATLNMPNAYLSEIESVEPWNLFKNVVTREGGLGIGDDFEYNGMTYTVIDAEAKTVRTKANWYQYAENLPEDMFDGTLVIPATVSDGTDDYTVVEIGTHTFDNCEPLTAISLPETLTSIAPYAFASCRNLTAINLPEGLDDLGTWAFGYCESLTSISIPSTVNSYGNEIFRACSSLSEVQFAASIPITYGMFMDCTSLESFDFSSVEGSIGEYGFNGCTSLKSVELSDDNLITEIKEHAFGSCNQLSTLRLPESILEIRENAFWGCDLTSLTLPASLTSIGHAAFDRNQNIGEVTYNATEPIPAFEDIFDTETADIYATATLNMPNATLASVQAVVPWNKFLHINASDGSVAPAADGDDFVYNGMTYTVIDVEAKTCKTKDSWYSLTEGISDAMFTSDFEIPSSVSDGIYDYTVVEIGRSTFSNCSALASIKLPETLTAIGEYAFDSSGITSIVIPEGVSEIQFSTFRFCNELTTVQLPSTLTVISDEAFKQSKKVVSVNFPDGLVSIGGYAFNECDALTEVRLPASVVSVGERAFAADYNLTVLELQEGLQEIGNYAFAHTGLSSVSIPASVADFGDMAFAGDYIMEVNYNALTPVVAPEDLFYSPNTDIYVTATLNTPYATLADIQATSPWNKFLRINASDGSVAPAGEGDDFEYEGIWYTVIDAEAKTVKTKEGDFDYDNQICYPGNRCVGDLVIPANVSDGSLNYTVVEIGSWGFGDNDITSVSLPQSLTTLSPCAFHNCIALTSVQIPDGVTEIGASVFCLCNNLQSVILPESINTLGSQAFGYCYNLRSINLPESLNTLEYGVFMGCNSLESIYLSDNITSIPADAFAGCGFNSISLPQNLTLIDFRAFGGCNNLTSIELPESLTILGENVFEDCSNLNSVTLPGALISIGNYAFKSCFDLTNVTYNAESPISCNENIFDVYNSANLNTPNATLASVQATSPWNKFLRINAANGSIAPVGVGEDFEFDGINYTVIDEVNHLVKTKNGNPETGESGNTVEGNVVIPVAVAYDSYEYTVTEIGSGSFFGNQNLLSVTIPGSVTNIGTDAFDGCERLTSIVWQGNFPLPMDEIQNPNLLVYVDDALYAPEWLDHNVVADGVCDSLVLTPGFAFTPLSAFTANHSEIMKSFTQQTPLGGCAGWETLAIPFEPTSITVSDGRALVPFSAFTDIDTQCPFWLYEADAAGEWKEASAIHQGVPYILAMPNNDEYADQYRIDGDVTFLTDEETLIAPETCVPYVTTWNSGREFRSLWIPLSSAEASDAMGLNVGISNLTGDDGQLLAPGSAFHADVLPKPLEAYVTRIDGRRAMPVRGDQSIVTMMGSDDGLRIAVESGSIILSSDKDRTVDILTIDGIIIRKADVKAGVEYRIENLTRGIYIVADRKITVK